MHVNTSHRVQRQTAMTKISLTFHYQASSEKLNPENGSNYIRSDKLVFPELHVLSADALSIQDDNFQLVSLFNMQKYTSLEIR